MLISIRNIKFINMRKFTTFITVVCVLFYFLCLQIDHHHVYLFLSFHSQINHISMPHKNNQNACKFSTTGPSPPLGFRAVNKTTTSIRLQWHHQQNSAITGYTVNYRPASSAEENQQSTVHGIHDQEEITITGLLVNVTYIITIQASDKNGTGPASYPIFVTTGDGSKFSQFLTNFD